MNEYTASNGIEVAKVDDRLFVGGGFQASAEGIVALREFFRADEDERLGRWRWPENPEYVVRRSDFDPTYLYVLDEPAMEVYGFNGFSDGDAEPEAQAAADAFRDAHPEPKPDWLQAKPGEIWAMTVGVGPEFVCTVDDSSGFPRFIDMADDMSYGPRSGFTAGRRIWPES